MTLGGKLQRIIGFELSVDQIDRIEQCLATYKAYLAGGYTGDHTRPSDAIKFLKQLKGHIDKVVEMGRELEPRLGIKHSLVPLLQVFSESKKTKNYLMPDGQIVTLNDFGPALEEYYRLLESLNVLSQGITSEIHEIGCRTQKGSTLDEWLLSTIKDLANLFEQFTGRIPKRSWDAYLQADRGLFLEFIEIILNHHNLECKNSLSYLVRVALEDGMA